MITVGLKSNPDVLLAEAKMRQAEAELLQARLKVTREIVELWNSKRKKELGLESMKVEMTEAEQLAGKGMMSQMDLRKTRSAYQIAAAELSEFNVTVRPLLGMGLSPDGRGGSPRQGAEDPKRYRGNWPDAQDDPLMKGKITVELTDVSVIDAAKAVFAKTPLNLAVDRNWQEGMAEEKVTLSLKDVTPKAALLAITDQAQVAFVRRDYGILMTTTHTARGIDAPAIPEGLSLD
jgi:hypothetical protein